MRLGVLALALAFPLALSGQQQNQEVPNAPIPQSTNSLGALAAGVTPGEGAPTAPDSASGEIGQTPPAAAPEPPPDTSGPPPIIQPPGEMEKAPPTITINVNAVTLPVTVLDSKHQEVAGLLPGDFVVLENGVPQHIAWFSADEAPLSVALVIDQSLTQGVMQKVNDSLRAIQGAFTPYDAVAVFTYSDGVNEVTNFTAAQGARLPAVLAASKAPGEQMGVPMNTGVFVHGPTINDKELDPNVEPGGSASGPFIVLPKEVHTLNDAILAAARALSTQPKGRRRIIYVISDGRESRSKASYKDVVHYLQSNEIQVFGTLVGDSAVWGLGYLDKIKLPLLPLSPDNILPRYVGATGGHLESEFSENGIQRSFADLAALGRSEYTIIYYSHVPVLNDSFRNVEVRVLGHGNGLEVHAPPGYYPMASAILH